LPNESNDLLKLAKEYGTLFIAVYGVIQVWLIFIWKKFSQKGKIQIFETGVLEIGYSAFGPTIAVNGTFQALRKNVFVSNVYIELLRLRDRAHHKFEWTAFRSTQISLVQPRQISLELPAGFIVRVDQPYRYQIILNDKQTQLELEQYLLALRRAWQSYLLTKQNEITLSLRNGAFTNETILQHLYNTDFSKNSQENQAAWEMLQRKNYWEPGSYLIKMVVETSNPTKTFYKHWQFELNDEACNSLKLNSIATLLELCTGIVNYQYAYPIYKSVQPNDLSKL
jgi:hypothetical protein